MSRNLSGKAGIKRQPSLANRKRFSKISEDSSRAPLYEVETAPGLADIVLSELKRVAPQCEIAEADHHSIRVKHSHISDLLRLKTAIAVYRIFQVTGARPTSFLGHENFHKLLQEIQSAVLEHGHPYTTLKISAAGSHTTTIRRLKERLAEALQLRLVEEAGDLLIRIRHRTPYWEALIRIGHRPLSTRSWRTENMQGALNASVAHAMCEMAGIRPDSVLVNICCGSGTILVEAASRSDRSNYLIGVDISRSALHLAQRHLRQSGNDENVLLIQADAKHLPFASRSIHLLAADLPFGQLVGSSHENSELYPSLFAEAGRVAAREARFIAITHAVRLMQRIVGSITSWKLLHERKIVLSGLHPRIYLFERSE